MELDLAQKRQEAHFLLDRLPEDKFLVVRNLLEVLTDRHADPLARSLANAPWEDEEIDEEEERTVAASKAWLQGHYPIPNEEVFAEFGLSAEDFERMGRTLLEPEPRHPEQ